MSPFQRMSLLCFCEMLIIILTPSAGYIESGSILRLRQRSTKISTVTVVRETDVFVLCHTGRHDNFYPLIWEVNETVYESSKLPDMFQLRTGGLFIPNVKQHMNNTSFRCYYPKQENGITLQRSSVGLLSVKPQSTNYNKLERIYRASNPDLHILEQGLYIDHQLLLFESDTKTLAWKISPGMGCYKYEVISKEHCDDSRTNPSIRNWMLTSNQNNITVSVSDTVANGSKSLYFNITGKTMEGGICQQTAGRFQVDESTITKKVWSTADGTIEANISTVFSPLYIALPLLKRNVTVKDCLCPIVIINENECDDLTRCFCYNDTAIVTFSHSVKVCDISTSSDLGKLQMVIHNHNDQANNISSRIHFYTFTICSYSDGNIGYSYPVRHYIDSYQVEVAEGLHDEPNVEVLKNGEVCFSYESNKSEVHSYEIIVYDRTGEIVYDETVPNSTNCTYIPQIKVECRPYKISVMAHLSLGHTTKTILQSEGFHMGNNTKCDCVLENGIFCYQIICKSETSTGATIEIICIQLYQSDIKLEIRQNGRHSYQIYCTGYNSTHQIESNSETDIYWVSPTNPEVECLLLEIQTYDHHNDKYIILGASITGVLVTTTIISIIIITIIKKIKLKKSKYDTSAQVTYKSFTKY